MEKKNQRREGSSASDSEFNSLYHLLRRRCLPFQPPVQNGQSRAELSCQLANLVTGQCAIYLAAGAKWAKKSRTGGTFWECFQRSAAEAVQNGGRESRTGGWMITGT